MNVWQYLVRRILSIIPTLLGMTIICFIIINLAPGSPIEKKIQEIRFSSSSGGTSENSGLVTKEVVDALKKQYGFDRPLLERYWIWLKNIATLDFGESFSYEEPVIDVIVSKFPVSLQFGIVSLILSYLICIPLGIFKAVKSNSAFDMASSVLLYAMYATPGFMLGVVLLVFFAGDSFLDIFPIGGLHSDFYENLGFFERMVDRIHHAFLPLICYMIGSFTTLTMLMKNSILDHIKKDYIRTARAKGLSEKVVYLKHALRNALIPVVTGLGSFISVFFAGSLLIETIFQLDGIGLLGYQSVLERDYNVLMGNMFIQSFLMLVGNIISDFAYIVVDPRIDFQ
ncbi:MAG: ABC transporter permease subunit [Bacteriovoracales bacterium]|nr:ABC transporter permease subunit [Bacteriovoracales bacterium]